MTTINNICVFCGSSIGTRTEYGEAAHNLGIELAHHKIGLVYGGGSTGLMGLIADSVLQHGGTVIGVIPEALVQREVKHSRLTEVYIVGSMHDRKAMMAHKSDAFVALPGGFGTMEELFEVITWAQLGIHHKPILLLNVEGYFDPLLNFIHHALEEGFIREISPALLRSTDDIQQVIPMLQETPDQDFRPKWMDISQT